MPVRNRHVVGDYLMVDDITGLVHYASEMARRWDGAYMLARDLEFRHPQEFIRARSDPEPVQNVRQAVPSERAFLATPIFVGSAGATTVRTRTDGAAYHLFDPGIGEMVVGISFLVR